MNRTAKGNRAELDAWQWLEEQGYLVGTRRKGRREKGPGDHLAHHVVRPNLIVEVKETGRGPYQDFLPRDREVVKALATRYGLEAMLLWRSAPSKPWKLIPADDWP